VAAIDDLVDPGDQRYRLQLHCCVLGSNLAWHNGGVRASSVSPDGKRYEQKIENNEYRHVSLPTDAEAVAMQTLAEDKVHAVPSH
jgi:hypothetical protein